LLKRELGCEYKAMPCYTMKSKPTSVEDYRLWQKELGFLGSYEKYKEAKSWTGDSVFFLCGDFGEHCADCGGVSEFLCDYPVGDGKTCDRNMCEEHAKEVSPDIHYCETHYKMWRDFVEKGGVDEQLKNVIAFKSEKQT